MKTNKIHTIVLAILLSIALSVAQQKPSSRYNPRMVEAEKLKVVGEGSVVIADFYDYAQDEDELIKGNLRYIASNNMRLGDQHSFAVSGTAVVKLHAKNLIYLGPGFAVEEGAIFVATVDERLSSESRPEKKFSAEHDANTPIVYNLGQNYPNPFNPGTVIGYDLPEGVHVLLKVYDVLGREVAKLVDEIQVAGFKSASFDATNLPSGIYYYRLNAGTFTDMKKMLLVK